ncbi:GGDEF domain-containing protein [Acuticoccus sp. I52.16.1]|nr:GGDEF domain-containing protein [Acuticoccus sp. I52.16.1]
MVLDVPFAAVVFPAGVSRWLSAPNPAIAALVERTIALGEPLALADCPAADTEPHLRAMIAAPFVTPHDGWGAVVAGDGTPRAFSERETRILAQFANCIISELELTERAETDDLTGLMRRQPFIATLSGLVADHAQSAAPAVLSIIDLDHFKRINDSHGHATGDAVLRTVADVMSDVLGAEAMLCRLGGEEFAVALPDHSLNTALPLLERARRAIAAMTIAEVERIAVTASFGVAPLSDAFANVSAWFKTADAALYTAKQSGRNQIRVGWQSDPKTGAATRERRGGDWKRLSVAV